MPLRAWWEGGSRGRGARLGLLQKDPRILHAFGIPSGMRSPRALGLHSVLVHGWGVDLVCRRRAGRAGGRAVARASSDQV